jgi:hypothetical protein
MIPETDFGYADIKGSDMTEEDYAVPDKIESAAALIMLELIDGVD